MVVPLDILKHELGKFSEYFALVQSSRLVYSQVTDSIVQYLSSEKEAKGIYVIETKPFVSIKDSLKKNSIDLSNIIFIDRVSAGIKVKTDDKNVIYLQNTKSLADLGFSIDSVLKTVDSSNRFIFFDSLNQLLMHNSTKEVIELLQLLNIKIREEKLKCIALIVEKDETVNDICQFFDKVISFR